jgi:uncharacterized glyoxalase superfamily protein PhnB
MNSHRVASERASEPRERSAPSKRRACERAGESEGRSPSGKTRTRMMERAVPHLPGDDLRVAKDFYVDKLGFTVTYEVTEDEGRTGMLGVERGTIALAIDCPMPGHGRDACVALHVARVDDYYNEWKGKVAVKRPPQNEDWGARTFDLIDPFGNTIFVLGPVT